MSWLNTVVDTLAQFRSSALLPLYLDLGSSRTRVMNAKRLVYDQPTCCMHTVITKDVIEVGDKAFQSLGALPNQVALFFPIRQGVLTHRLLTQLYLSAVLRKSVVKQEQRVLLSARGACAIPSSLSPVEKKTLREVLRQSGWGGLQLVPKSEALYALLQARQGAHPSVAIIDIGAETTEVALFHRSQSVLAATLPLGGRHYTKIVSQIVSQEFHTLISEEMAEHIKHQHRDIPFWSKSDVKKTEFKVPFRGKDSMTQVPQTLYVSNYSLHATFLELTQRLFVEIQLLLDTVPDTTLTSVLESGVYITGGASLLPGIKEYFQEQLKCQLIPSTAPRLDVVEGLVATGRK